MFRSPLYDTLSTMPNTQQALHTPHGYRTEVAGNTIWSSK